MSRLLKMRGKFLENCHKHRKCQQGKFLWILSSLQNYLNFLRQKIANFLWINCRQVSSGCWYSWIEKLLRIQIKIFSFLKTILIPYLTTCTSVLIDTKYIVFRNKILMKTSVGWGKYSECPDEKKCKNFDSTLLNFRDSLPDIWVWILTL